MIAESAIVLTLNVSFIFLYVVPIEYIAAYTQIAHGLAEYASSLQWRHSRNLPQDDYQQWSQPGYYLFDMSRGCFVHRSCFATEG